jgi:hypothetical protein
VISVVGVAVGALGLAVGAAGPALAGAEVVRPPDCGWVPDAEAGEAESIPGTGVTDPIAATACQLVFTPAGRVNYVLRGVLPEGASVQPALVGPGLVVTPSGRINSHGSF